MPQDTTNESTGFPNKGESFREGDNYTVPGMPKRQVQLLPGWEGVYPDKPDGGSGNVTQAGRGRP